MIRSTEGDFSSPWIDFAISHNREDLALTKRLLLKLEQLGFIGWIDANAYYIPTSPAEKQIELAFHKARFVVLLVGTNYRDSAWCREEYEFALQSETDLSITRVIVALESTKARERVPRLLLNAPTFDLSAGSEIPLLRNFDTRDESTLSRLSEWHRLKRRSGLSLIDRLPKDERLKLVGDHLAFLLSVFTSGIIPTDNHQSALRLELTAGSPNPFGSHFSPAVFMEMGSRWTFGIIGEHLISHHLNAEDDSSDVADLHSPELKVLFERLLPMYLDYLSSAVSRRATPPRVTKHDLFAILDHVICSFLAVLVKTKQCEENLVDGVRNLLNTAAFYGDKRVADAANYLADGLPTIGLPSFNVSRGVHLYRLLGQSN